MALIVDTNSYVNAATADTYFDDAIHAEEWETADLTDKDKSLVTSARILERQYWLGDKTSDVQALSFPRTGVSDRNGIAIDSATVPQDIKDAQCELALALLIDPSLQEQSTASVNTKRVKAGSAVVEFFKPIHIGRFPTIIQELIKPYFSGAGGITVGVNAASENSSSFAIGGDFNLREGYS